MIRIVQLQFSTGSAGKSATRLQHAFREAGYGVDTVSLYGEPGNNEELIVMRKWVRKKARIEQLWHERRQKRIPDERGAFTYPVLGSDPARLEAVRQADIIYVHWVLLGFMNLRSFRRLAALDKPVVIFLHDMWPVTGGCHNSFDCTGYTRGCGSCPMFDPVKERDLSYRGFHRKASTYRLFRQLAFVSPSRWLKETAEKSPLTDGRTVHYIPNVMDRRSFGPGHREDARKHLQIKGNRKVIGFGAFSISNPFKGWEYFIRSLEVLKNDYPEEDVLVLVFGGEYDPETSSHIPFESRFTGFIRNEEELALLYQAMDVYVVPSVADNQPTTVMEALWCGTPVAAFRVGGIPDMIEHRGNGYLAGFRDPEDLATGIRFIIENGIGGSVHESFDPAKILARHTELIESLLSNRI